MSETETPQVVEPAKSSRMQRIKDAAITAAWITIPVAVTGGLMYASLKMTKMQLETSRLNLEAAKLNKS
jgi:hypothetical protein